MLRKTLLLTSALVLAGCINQSAIQGKYVRNQDECRREITRSAAASGNPDQTPNAAVAAQFSNCMNKLGWHVPVPKPGQVATGPVPNPPTGSPSTDPIASLSTASPPTQVAGPVPVNPQVVNPPTGAPSTAPSAAVSAVAQPAPGPGVPNLRSGAPSSNPAAAVPSANIPKPAAVSTSATGQTVVGPATYQPARPVPTTGVSYGNGAGRQF